jgi:uncharacterized phiE125 gp8 family phage protein
MNWYLKHVSGPSADPITLADAKLHLQVDHSADDALITRLITVAREHCEAFTGRVLGTQTFAQTQEDFSLWCPIFAAPLVSVESITYVDGNGVTQTWNAAEYRVIKRANAYGSIEPAYGFAYPAVRCQSDAVVISFTAGEAASASLIAGMLLLIGHLYANREAVVIDKSAVTLPLAVESLWTPYRIF